MSFTLPLEKDVFWVLWILGIPLLIVTLGGYLFHARDVGYAVAFRDLVLFLVAISIAVTIISGLVRAAMISALDLFELAAWSARLIVAIAWLAVGFGLWRKRRAGPVLVDIGRSKRRTLLSFGAGLALLVLISDVAWPVLRSGVVPAEISADLILVSLGLCALGLSLPEIREAGIYSFAQHLRWERIKSYEWRDRTGHTLRVRPKRRWLGLRTVSFTVPRPLWHSVNDLFSECAPGSEIGTPRSSPLQRLAGEQSRLH